MRTAMEPHDFESDYLLWEVELAMDGVMGETMDLLEHPENIGNLALRAVNINDVE